MKFNFTNTISAFLVAIGLFITINTRAQVPIITTVAGDGGQNYTGDGIAATESALNLPQGVAVDSSGNIYIADTWNNRIRKVSNSTGIITTIAGNGAIGFSGDNGKATSAELFHPIGITLDDSGNVYFTDNGNQCIRKVSKTTGIITTIAGKGGVNGFTGDNGPATAAELSSPFGISFDKSGNLFIADETNSRIREIDNTTGIITTIAGTGVNGFGGDGGPATAATFFFPTDVVIDTAGNIYISDAPVNNRVRKIDAKTGSITTVAGTGGTDTTGNGGQATAAEFNSPAYLALDDSGNVYISDLLNAEVRKLNVSTGIVTAFAGDFIGGFSGDGGPAGSAELNEPSGLAVDVCGNLYITERGNSRIREVTIVRPLTNTYINAALATSSICPGEQVAFTDSSNFRATGWKWHFNGATPDSSNSPNPVVVYNGTGSYDVSIIAYDLCDNATQTISKYITVTPAPPFIIQPTPAAVCPGNSVVLSAPLSGTGYTWSPAATLNTSTGDSVTATPSAATTYTVTGTDSLGCPASGTDVVSISSPPSKPTITQVGNVITSSSTQGNQWVRSDSVLQGATNQNYTVSIAGWYQVITVNPANGCSATSDSEYIIPSGINQLTVESGQLIVYPNPTGGEVFITINLSVVEVKDWKLQVTDVLGRTLITKSSINYNNAIDLSNLSSGMYFISVVNKTGRVVVPVVKE